MGAHICVYNSISDVMLLVLQTDPVLQLIRQRVLRVTHIRVLLDLHQRNAHEAAGCQRTHHHHILWYSLAELPSV